MDPLEIWIKVLITKMTEYRIDRFVRDSLYIKEKGVGGVTCNAALLDTCKYDIDVSRFRHAWKCVWNMEEVICHL